MKKLFLRQILKKEKLVVEHLPGRAIIANARRIFWYIDKDFKAWGLDKPGKPTPRTELRVHKNIMEADFHDMLYELAVDWSGLVLTQSQIIWFCRKYPRQLSRHGHSFFLAEEGGEYYVVSVRVYGRRLHIGVFRHSYSYDWPKAAGRLIVPNLKNV